MSHEDSPGAGSADHFSSRAEHLIGQMVGTLDASAGYPLGGERPGDGQDRTAGLEERVAELERRLASLEAALGAVPTEQDA